LRYVPSLTELAVAEGAVLQALTQSSLPWEQAFSACQSQAEQRPPEFS